MFPTFNSKAAKGFIKNAIWLAIPVCLVLLLATSALAEESITKSTSPGPAESNTACEKCHMDIFSYWNQSRHNQSTTNVFYKQALQEFQKLQDVSKLPRGKDFCKTCHEPLLATGGNDKAANGVQCEFCHSIKDVQLGRRPSPFILEKGPTKYGPLGEVQSPAHPTRKSELFSTSLLCAGCHEWKNDAGLSILSTYSEWQESGLQKEDTHCQSCHMAEVEGQVSDPKLSRITSGKVNTHQFTGGHTASQLHKAVSIKIKDISIEKEDLTVRLEVRNIGSGHYFPTGMPTRRVEIEVSVKTAGSEPEVKNQISHRARAAACAARRLVEMLAA